MALEFMILSCISRSALPQLPSAKILAWTNCRRPALPAHPIRLLVALRARSFRDTSQLIRVHLDPWGPGGFGLNLGLILPLINGI